jgi:hypothetical protein
MSQETASEAPNVIGGLAAGALGGLAGALAARLYTRVIAPSVFPPEANPSGYDINPAHSIAIAGRHYRAGETAAETLGRLGSQLLTGAEPDTPEARAEAADRALLIGGTVWGALQGLSAASGQPGLASGVSMWFNDTLLGGLVGLRPGPRAYNRSQHMWRLGGHVVYSMVAGVVTRMLYRLFR